MFIYAFIHLHINILKPSQCLNLILRQLFCINFSTRIKSSQFTSHSTCFFRYTCIHIYIYIQYQINILKPLQCPQLQRAQGYVQLAPARKLAWVFVFWLALAQVSWRGGVPTTNLSPCMECLNVSNTETKYTHAYLLDLLCIQSTE